MQTGVSRLAQIAGQIYPRQQQQQQQLQLISFAPHSTRKRAGAVLVPSRRGSSRSQYACACCLPVDTDDPDFFDGSEFMLSIQTTPSVLACSPAVAMARCSASSPSSDGVSDRSSVPNVARKPEQRNVMGACYAAVRRRRKAGSGSGRQSGA
jgi:hypothetical protein